ncbi:MAG: GIY-YIG nuclease family protein [Rikenellaceae bacterium]
MLDKSAQLLAIFDHPIFDDVKPIEKPVSSHDRIIEGFEEISSFYDKHKREPKLNGSIVEQRLASRLKSIRENENKRSRCEQFDRNNLLNKAPNLTIDEILNHPIFETNPEITSIFDVPKHLIKQQDRDRADYVAQRAKCENFNEFKHLFEGVHADLSTGRRALCKFQEASLQEGRFFIVDGMIVYLNKIFDKKKDKSGKLDGRTHCIYENGMESYLLLRSIGKAIFADGQGISEIIGSEQDFINGNLIPSEEKHITGSIYVLKSHSTDPALSPYLYLHKIGFTTRSVEERLAHAEKDSTYLKAKVTIAAEWKIANIKASQIESDLHRLFAESRLDIKVGEGSESAAPDEWFDVPLSLIKNAIHHLINGRAISYDRRTQTLTLHESQPLSSKLALTNKRILQLRVSSKTYSKLLNGERDSISCKIKASNARKYADYSRNEGTYQLIRFDVISFSAKSSEEHQLFYRTVTGITYNEKEKEIQYKLGEKV